MATAQHTRDVYRWMTKVCYLSLVHNNHQDVQSTYFLNDFIALFPLHLLYSLVFFAFLTQIEKLPTLDVRLLPAMPTY